MGNVQIQLDLPQERVDQIEEVMEDCGIETKKDFFNNAISLFWWVVRESKRQRVIASISESEKIYTELVMPALDFAKKNVATTNDNHSS